MTANEEFISLLDNSLNELVCHKQIAIISDCEQRTRDLHDAVIAHLNKVKNLFRAINPSNNYINQFRNEVNQILNLFPYRSWRGDLTQVTEIDKKQIRNQIEINIQSVENQLQSMLFNFDFFQKLDFFQNNMVVVGANGSGKTTLSNGLKKYLPGNGVVISAQKILIIPTFSGISNINSTYQKLHSNQVADKMLKTTYSTESSGNAYSILVQLGGEFQVLLDNLLAERSAKRNIFCDNFQKGDTKETVPVTKLDKALDIWNSLILHRVMKCEDGINITLQARDSECYPAYQMSDGEKVILYYIAQVLQAPEFGFIIIDEPEMYLHKTILQKLWDTLEKERQDCIFIYLTHDLDFATSRIVAKKIWIKSFIYPDKWEIENIPENDLPKTLLLELLGSRKNILFCEGEKGSIDEKIYNILFKEYTITPVGTCSSVINYTKAFNKLSNINTKAIGLIDSDHHGIDRLESLRTDGVFSFSMTEPENLLLDENFLRILAKAILIEDGKIDLIKKDVLKQLEMDIVVQVSNYVSAKINYHFKESHVAKGNSLEDVKANYKKFADEIKIQDWFTERETQIKDIIAREDYKKALSLFNNKGLRTIANKHLKISDFTERAIKLLSFTPSCHEMLLNYFPVELKR